MAYRCGNREQKMLLPPSVEEYIAEDAPVRAYDAMIEAMDLEVMGIEEDGGKVGNPQYHPRAMVKLWTYGCSYGFRSSRKLERACHYDLSFIWLMGGLKPDHKTISEFRRKNKQALGRVLSQTARISLDMGLISGNVLFMDGTKLRANASLYRGWTQEKCERELSRIDGQIETLLTEIGLEDEAEAGEGSLVHLQEELKDQERMKDRIREVLGRLQEDGGTWLNTTDEECTRVKGRQGCHAGYSGQVVVDDEHGLVVSSDVVPEANDTQQFVNQLEQARETLGRAGKVAVADMGYVNYERLEAVDRDETTVIIPSRTQARRKEVDPFDKSRFVYDEETDSYECPLGHRLEFGNEARHVKERHYYGGKTCRSCEHFGQCTTSRSRGRKIRRFSFEGLRQDLERCYEEPESQEIYRRRKAREEHPFGHFKRNLNAGYFLLRGLDGVRAEMSLMAASFNITRMITVLGVPTLVHALQER